MRAIAKRLLLAQPTRAPPVCLIFFHIDPIWFGLGAIACGGGGLRLAREFPTADSSDEIATTSVSCSEAKYQSSVDFHS